MVFITGQKKAEIITEQQYEIVFKNVFMESSDGKPPVLDHFEKRSCFQSNPGAVPLQ